MSGDVGNLTGNPKLIFKKYKGVKGKSPTHRKEDDKEDIEKWEGWRVSCISDALSCLAQTHQREIGNIKHLFSDSVDSSSTRSSALPSRYTAFIRALLAPLYRSEKKKAKMSWTCQHRIAYILGRQVLTSAPTSLPFNQSGDAIEGHIYTYESPKWWLGPI